MTLDILLMLFCVAVLAAWVDAIAGGGGLIAIPALLLAGLPPAAALATNKLQGSAGTLSASIYFIRKKTVDLHALKWPILATFIGSVIGSWLVLTIDADKLMKILPFLLIGMGLYFWHSPKIGDWDSAPKVTLLGFACVAAPLLGFYDGFFGPGTGSLMALAGVILLGYSLPKATANAKILNFVSNISALGYFILFGDIYWQVGGIMIIGQLIGANLGARMIIRNGTGLIKPVVVCVCFLMSANLLWKALA